MEFKTDYKDDIINTTSNEKRQYEMIQNDNGTVSFNDVTVYEQVGDTLGAKELNEISEKLNISGERIRYNNVTDMVQILNDDGVWEDWSSGVSAVALIKNGVIISDYYSHEVEISTSDNFLCVNAPSSGSNYISLSFDFINYAGKYIKIVAKSDSSSANITITTSGMEQIYFNLSETEKSLYLPITKFMQENGFIQLSFSVGSNTYIKTIEITASDGTSSGGGGSDDVELTQAQYDALPDTKLTDNKNYFIKDATENNGNLVRNGKSYTGGGVDIESEVIDIRLKADGTKATSAGNAVREQVAELKEDLDWLKSDENFYDTKSKLIFKTDSYKQKLSSSYYSVDYSKKIIVDNHKNIVANKITKMSIMAGQGCTMYVGIGHYTDTGSFIVDFVSNLITIATGVTTHTEDVYFAPLDNKIVYNPFVIPKEYGIKFGTKSGTYSIINLDSYSNILGEHTNVTKYTDNGIVIVSVDEAYLYSDNLLVTSDELDKYAKKTDIPSIPNYFNSVVKKPFSFGGKNIAFFGDSITQGFTDMGQHVTNNGYPKQFSDRVGATYSNYGIGGSCYTSGYNDATTMLDKIKSISNLSSFDFVFLANGVNDWQLGVPLNEFSSAVISTFDYIKQNFENDIVVIAPINNNFHNAEITNIDSYRKIIYEQALLHNFSFVNGGDFGFPTESGNLANYLFGDGMLHPSEKGYTLYTNGLATCLC